MHSRERILDIIKSYISVENQPRGKDYLLEMIDRIQSNIPQNISQIGDLDLEFEGVIDEDRKKLEQLIAELTRYNKRFPQKGIRAIEYLKNDYLPKIRRALHAPLEDDSSDDEESILRDDSVLGRNLLPEEKEDDLQDVDLGPSPQPPSFPPPERRRIIPPSFASMHMDIGLEIKAAELDIKAAELERKAAELDLKAAEIERQRAAELKIKAAELERSSPLGKSREYAQLHAEGRVEEIDNTLPEPRRTAVLGLKDEKKRLEREVEQGGYGLTPRDLIKDRPAITQEEKSTAEAIKRYRALDEAIEKIRKKTNADDVLAVLRDLKKKIRSTGKHSFGLLRGRTFLGRFGITGQQKLHEIIRDVEAIIKKGPSKEKRRRSTE